MNSTHVFLRDVIPTRPRFGELANGTRRPTTLNVLDSDDYDIDAIPRYPVATLNSLQQSYALNGCWRFFVPIYIRYLHFESDGNGISPCVFKKDLGAQVYTTVGDWRIYKVNDPFLLPSDKSLRKIS